MGESEPDSVIIYGWQSIRNGDRAAAVAATFSGRRAHSLTHRRLFLFFLSALGPKHPESV